MNLTQTLFSFDGRIGRGTYWIFVVVLAVVGSIVGGIESRNESPGLIAGIVSLLLLWPGLAIQIKRWHDRDKSGWWVLIGLIPIIGGIWQLVECGFLPGTPGPNRYGPVPGAALQMQR